jgi:hypothetical protein
MWNRNCLPTLPGYMSLPPVLSEVRGTQSLVFYVMFCRLLFVYYKGPPHVHSLLREFSQDVLIHLFNEIHITRFMNITFETELLCSLLDMAIYELHVLYNYISSK